MSRVLQIELIPSEGTFLRGEDGEFIEIADPLLIGGVEVSVASGETLIQASKWELEQTDDGTQLVVSE